MRAGGGGLTPAHLCNGPCREGGQAVSDQSRCLFMFKNWSWTSSETERSGSISVDYINSIYMYNLAFMIAKQPYYQWGNLARQLDSKKITRSCKNPSRKASICTCVRKPLWFELISIHWGTASSYSVSYGRGFTPGACNILLESNIGSC